MQEAGKYLVIIGFLVAAIGAVFHFGWAPAVFGWMGHLPGDIKVEKENFRFYFPLTTCIILSILLTVIIRILMMFKPH